MVDKAEYWVQLASICDRFKCLPEPGSLYDQRKRTIDRLLSAIRAMDEVEADRIERESKKPTPK